MPKKKTSAKTFRKAADKLQGMRKKMGKETKKDTRAIEIQLRKTARAKAAKAKRKK